MSNRERWEQVNKLLIEMVDNWSEEQVAEYTLPESFDEVVHKFLLGVTMRSDELTMIAIVDALQKRGAPASYEYPGFISIGEWNFGIENGELVGNTSEPEAVEGAELESTIPSADSIEKFLRGLAHMGRLPWDKEVSNV